jgi:magnesium transporter
MNNFEQNEVDFTPIFDALSISPFVLPEYCKHYPIQTWALLLESLTNEQRLIIWPTIDKSLKSSLLAEMREDSRSQLLNVLPEKNVAFALKSATGAEAIEIINSLSGVKASLAIKKLSSTMIESITVSQGYKEDEVGRYANPDVYTITVDDDIQKIISDITESGLPQFTDSLVVIDKDGVYQGLVDINAILTASPDDSISALVHDEPSIKGVTSVLDASSIIKATKRSMLAIVTENNVLIGRISISDALNIFQGHYEAQISHLGKVSDEDLFAPTLISARRRATWLGINLITAFMASFVIGVFDVVVAEVVALAVLMPIVASMGGITGSQTLTLTIRGLATGQLSQGNLKTLRNKELRVSSINGVIWATVVAIITGYWFDNYWLSGILALALIINMFVAAFFGILIPVTLDKLKIDPALAGSVILTTVTDVIGFFVFLGTASLVFLN